MYNENEIIKERNKKVNNYFINKKEILNSDRKSILFSKIPNKQVNPDRYESLVTFWNNSLIDISKSFNILLFTPKLLNDLFTVDNVKPIYLPLVLNELLKLNHISKSEEFLNKLQQQNNGWSKWIWNKAVVQPFQYYTGIGSKSLLPPSEDKNLKLILEEIILDKAEELYQEQLNKINSTTDNITSILNLEKHFTSKWSITKEEFELLIQVLLNQNKAILLYDGKEKKGIKFAMDGEKITNDQSNLQSDLGILKLQITLETLKQQENKLMIDIEEINMEIKKSVKLKQKNLALSQLKKKKLLESILDKRGQASHSIHEILFSIESAQSNQQIMQSLVHGVSTLKEVNKQISVEQVDNVLDDYQNEMANQREIDEVMRSGFNNVNSISSLDMDDDLLEKELDEMEKEHNKLIIEKEKQEKEKLEKEKLEKENLEKEKLEKENLEKENLEKEIQLQQQLQQQQSIKDNINPNLPIPNKDEEDELLKELELLTLATPIKKDKQQPIAES